MPYGNGYQASAIGKMLVIGPSPQVWPAALVSVAAAEPGADLVFFNRTPTPYDDLAAVRFDESAGAALSALAAALKDTGR